MKRILIVDDSRTIRNLILLSLGLTSFSVYQAEDGQEALDLLGEVNPDLLITDVHMPRLDGLQLIERVRNSERFKALPILVLSTETEREYKLKARSAGATGWISKPIEAALLINAIHRVLELAEPPSRVN
jgi:two-component system chemotaxis response regulator CheY